ncbi:Arc family DNA-binding protein [Faecalibacterium sp.]|uniref:Arc family DNA-binding protein n=1 Tax=Faecalibacterium sp. TaxID=1971605 RepID=UPI00205A03A4|nr:MAG TPA: ParG [Caudoviricetes sp.]
MAKAKFDQQAYKDAYNKAKYDQIIIRLPAGSKDKIKEKAAAKGMSVTAYIWQLIQSDE